MDFQPLEEEVFGKAHYMAKSTLYNNGWSTHVEWIITSLAFGHLTSLRVTYGVLKTHTKASRAFLKTRKVNAFRGKCKSMGSGVLIEFLGGINLMNTQKFARALRSHWPWFEWTDTHKALVGFGNPCDAHNMYLFYTATTIMVGNGMKALGFLRIQFVYMAHHPK
jgi:hypothetical protein